MFTCGTSLTVINCLKPPPPPEYTPGEKFRLWKSFRMCQQLWSNNDGKGQESKQ